MKKNRPFRGGDYMSLGAAEWTAFLEEREAKPRKKCAMGLLLT